MGDKDGKKPIAREQVRHVARLASLRLEEDEVERLGAELGDILGYMAALDTVDVSAVEPTFHALPLRAPLRADEVVTSQPREVFLAGAPKAEAGGFAVPKVLDGEG